MVVSFTLRGGVRLCAQLRCAWLSFGAWSQECQYGRAASILTGTQSQSLVPAVTATTMSVCREQNRLTTGSPLSPLESLSVRSCRPSLSPK